MYDYFRASASALALRVAPVPSLPPGRVAATVHATAAVARTKSLEPRHQERRSNPTTLADTRAEPVPVTTGLDWVWVRD